MRITWKYPGKSIFYSFRKEGRAHLCDVNTIFLLLFWQSCMQFHMKRRLTGSTPVVGSSNRINCGTAIYTGMETIDSLSFIHMLKKGFFFFAFETLFIDYIPSQWRCSAFVWFHPNSTWFWHVCIESNPCVSAIFPPHDGYDDGVCHESKPYIWEFHRLSCMNLMHPLEDNSRIAFYTVRVEEMKVIDQNNCCCWQKWKLRFTNHSRLIEAAHAIYVDITVRYGCIMRKHFKCGSFTSSIDTQQTKTFT